MPAIDENLIKVMDQFLFMAKQVDPDHSDEWYRMKIVAANLKGLANVLLQTYDQGEITIDLQKTALGLLGTADWLDPE